MTTRADQEVHVDREKTPARKRSIFNLYTKIFRVLLAKWVPLCDQLEEEERLRELGELILPSNEDWRHRVYYGLVELQRECDAEPKMSEDGGLKMETAKSAESKDEKWEWDPATKARYPLKAKEDRNLESSMSLKIVTAIDGSMTEACIEPGWRISDILLAANVLQRTSPPPRYSDEAEMRRVFGLVYDVLRYKNVLNHALKDVGFWYRNRSLKDRERIVWLLLYDLQGRKFARRGEIAAIEERERLFKNSGLKEIEDVLLETKTHLAASVSRLRIGGSALNLDELLPIHLRMIEGVTWRDGASIASGWVNSIKVKSKVEFTEEMVELGFVFCEDCETSELNEMDYVFDPLCPKIVNFHDKAREKLATSTLVQNHRFVFLERSMCLGATILAHAIRVGRLCGPVVLTHSVAPRHTGYLAGLLADIEDAGRLLAFGTGEHRYEYETYLANLGITLQRCRVFSEKYILSPASAELERATVVLAVPPCSYTGVKDIVDLAVARGGDTELLESVTSGAANGEDVKQSRTLLVDQLATLKYALTRPNVQFLIYEAHTILPSETTEMVKQVVDYANQMAMEKYIREHPPKKKATKETSAKSVKSGKTGKIDESQEDDTSSTISTDVTVPASDLFEVGSIEDIYGKGSSCMMDPGCFLAVIKRKEMMQFDSLFMIKVAESKGLFGDPNESEKVKREPIPTAVPVRRPSQTNRREMKRAKIEIERIMAPTHSSLIRTTKENQICPRHNRHDTRREKLRILQVSDDSENDKTNNGSSYSSRLAFREQQRESVKRLSKPKRRVLSRQVYKSIETPNTGRESSREDNSYFSVTNFGMDTSGGGIAVAGSSTALRRSELIRAIQRIPLELSTEQREENISGFLWQRAQVGRVSRLHHPGGFVKRTRVRNLTDIIPADYLPQNLYDS